MHRVRQVRHRYPQALIELTVLLATQYSAREVAKRLQLPLSTIYRWVSTQSRDAGLNALARNVRDLISECNKYGFYPTIAGEAKSSNELEATVNVRAPNPNSQTCICPQPTEPLIELNIGRKTMHPYRKMRGAELARHVIEARYYSRLSCQNLGRVSGLTNFQLIRAFKALYNVSHLPLFDSSENFARETPTRRIARRC